MCSLAVSLGGGLQQFARTDAQRVRPAANWTINPHVQISISAVHGFTGSLVERAGGRDFNYGALTLDLKG
jgi:hypothetical protein